MTKTAFSIDHFQHGDMCREDSLLHDDHRFDVESDDVLVKKLTQKVFRMDDRNELMKEVRKKLQAGIYYLTSEELIDAMIMYVKETRAAQ